MNRRDFIKLGLAGATLASLNTRCQTKSEPGPPDEAEELYELTDGTTLYDDFDGNGNLQTYNGQGLADSGRLSSKLWDASRGSDIVQEPAAQGLLTVADEHGERVEYRRRQGEARETEYVFDSQGRLIRAAPHVPGEPYHGSQLLNWVGAQDGTLGAQEGSAAIKNGSVYGSAAVVPSGGRGWVLRLTSALTGLMGCLLANPRYTPFVDFKTLRADVMVPSTSTARNFYASLDYHTTIPEQPPGKSWVSDIGLHKVSSGELYLFAQCVNVNYGNGVYFQLGRALFDTWYNVRQDIVTRGQDPFLGEDELRIEYYVNGVLRETKIPEDSKLLLDPSRTGWGPNRLLIVFISEGEGEGTAFFDNVKGVYSDRIR